METLPPVVSPEEIKKREGYQAMQPVTRPDYWGVDRELSRRPGVPHERKPPRPFPNTRFPPEKQQTPSAVPMHGRPNKSPVPVYGTSTPLHGLSGAVRRLGYALPDHEPAHWMLILLGDRVDSWTYRAKKLAPLLLPVAAVTLLLRRGRERSASSKLAFW